MTHQTTLADILAVWRFPTVIVSANRLGTINPTLLTIEEAVRCARSRCWFRHERCRPASRSVRGDREHSTEIVRRGRWRAQAHVDWEQWEMDVGWTPGRVGRKRPRSRSCRTDSHCQTRTCYGRPGPGGHRLAAGACMRNREDTTDVRFGEQALRTHRSLALPAAVGEGHPARCSRLDTLLLNISTAGPPGGQGFSPCTLTRVPLDPVVEVT